MNNETSDIVKQAAEVEVERIKQQLAASTPESLTKTGTETSITEIPASGYIIDQPGRYVLEKSCTSWNPTPKAIAAIVIQCSDVEIDFKGNGIAQGANPNPMVHGIAIIDPEGTCFNVSIKNGTLFGMGLSGILAVNTENLSITGIKVEGLAYSGYEQLPAAFSFLMCNSYLIKQCMATSISVTAKVAGGFMVIASKTGILTQCTVENFTNNDGVACGFPYVLSDGIITEHCTARSLTTYSANNVKSDFGHTCIGYMVTDCTALIYNHCSSHHMHGCCDDCHGMSMWPGNNVQITNFHAHDVHDGLGPQKTGAKATGIEVYGTNVTVKDCEVKNITAIVPQFAQAAGFSALGNNITFENCKAHGVKVLDADSIPSTFSGYGTGFGWAPDPRINNPAAVQISYFHCVADDCQLGFDTWDHQQSRWEHVSALKTPIIQLIQPTSTERVLSQNFCSELANSFPGESGTTFIMKNIVDSTTNQYPHDWTSGMQRPTE